MTDSAQQTARSQDLTAKVSRLYRRRAELAQERFKERTQRAFNDQIAELLAKPLAPWDIWTQWFDYATDLTQRTILFWDTLRRRSNDVIAHERGGPPPLLRFDCETVLDARRFERPANLALVRIVPPPGVVLDPGSRPYVIIDPRVGRGPGSGAFRDDAQVGVVLQEGHPVYLVIFFPESEPDQTLLDVCGAEQQFVHKIRELHPDSPKPVIVGNRQGGWAAMMLASSNPEDTGPIVINGAPMSSWGGAGSEGDNPMRYTGGMLGGTWMASLAADLGNGLLDGAFLLENMEQLNPANSFWDKYYHLLANVDTEPRRLFDFERWWGGFYLLNREEIEWIVDQLLGRNEPRIGEVRAGGGKPFDVREVRSPIVLFASMGDNIAPPQEAFNWVADVYGSTDEIKSRGQTIVGLLHQDIGHLGTFVSGRIAREENGPIASVLASVEALPPGLYGMRINEIRGADGKIDHEVELVEQRLEEVMERMNRQKRADEKPLGAVVEIAELNQQAYELFARPLVQTLSNDLSAKLGREFHPLRFQHWALSDLNPWLQWLGPAADQVRSQRQTASPDQPFRQAETMVSELVSASVDYYRDIRDATSEALFFQTYGNLFSLYLGEEPPSSLPSSTGSGREPTSPERPDSPDPGH